MLCLAVSSLVLDAFLLSLHAFFLTLGPSYLPVSTTIVTLFRTTSRSRDNSRIPNAGELGFRRHSSCAYQLFEPSSIRITLSRLFSSKWSSKWRVTSFYSGRYRLRKVSVSFSCFVYSFDPVTHTPPKRRPEDYNAFGYNPRGGMAKVSVLLFSANSRPDLVDNSRYPGPQAVAPRFGPQHGYLGALQFQ